MSIDRDRNSCCCGCSHNEYNNDQLLQRHQRGGNTVRNSSAECIDYDDDECCCECCCDNGCGNDLNEKFSRIQLKSCENEDKSECCCVSSNRGDCGICPTSCEALIDDDCNDDQDNCCNCCIKSPITKCMSNEKLRYCPSERRMFFIRSHWIVFGTCCIHLKMNCTYEPRVIDLLTEFCKYSKIAVPKLELFYNERRLDRFRNTSFAKLGVPNGARLCVHCSTRCP
ncbi:hypothetical protein GJ496_008030 [Pomphorhynchus laevis]|nr:hypothetical protein GJ496_008030 [Pomphorhynchus laevis]